MKRKKEKKEMLWSMSTTVREAERIVGFLQTASQIDGMLWNNETQRRFQILLIQHHEYLKDSENLALSLKLYTDIDKVANEIVAFRRKLSANGDDCQLFRLQKQGTFQIWTRQTLEEHGFHPEHAPYYIVLRFSPTPVPMQQLPDLRLRVNTYRARIRPLSDFVGI